MNAIVCADKNFGIGRKGKLLASIPSDKLRFYELTRNKTVIYGRKTLQTLPGARPLKERENIILSKNLSFNVYGAKMARSLDELKGLIKDLESGNVFCIGGQSVYELLWPMFDAIYLTRMDMSFDADRYFPNIDADSHFQKVYESEAFQFNDWWYCYCKYEKF